MTQNQDILSEDEAIALIRQFQAERASMHTIMDKLVSAPWRALAREGLTTLGARACMLQEKIPLSKARNMVRDFANSSKASS